MGPGSQFYPPEFNPPPRYRLNWLAYLAVVVLVLLAIKWLTPGSRVMQPDGSDAAPRAASAAK